MELRFTDTEWKLIRPYLSQDPAPRHPGRPRANYREVLEGIFWILISGGRWQDMPAEYPARSTCHKYFQRWAQDGSLDRVRRVLVHELKRRGQLWLEEGFIDGSFARAKKGGQRWPAASRAKAQR